MIDLRTYIRHLGTIKAASEALGLDRLTLRRRLDDGVVIDGKLYAPVTPRQRKLPNPPPQDKACHCDRR